MSSRPLQELACCKTCQHRRVRWRLVSVGTQFRTTSDHRFQASGNIWLCRRYCICDLRNAADSGDQDLPCACSPRHSLHLHMSRTTLAQRSTRSDLPWYTFSWHIPGNEHLEHGCGSLNIQIQYIWPSGNSNRLCHGATSTHYPSRGLAEALDTILCHLQPSPLYLSAVCKSQCHTSPSQHSNSGDLRFPRGSGRSSPRNNARRDQP
mmetsp:Transcript_38811/g.70005  ORF Transcript_38811/g.70005 Transcript_38811/m.70005 type:complete len:207 (+) Transcript_38811:2077-2697(+)